MSSKSGTKIAESSNKQLIISNGLTSASASTFTAQNNSGFVQQRTNVRATSAKYYDIASTILGGSGDVEELFLSSAKNGNYKKLEQLLQSSEIGLNINCADKRTGNTALIWASKRGHSKVAELLLRYGADATVCNYEAHTALETAFSPAKTVILDWVETQEELNERLLLQASWQGNLSIVRKILQNKSHINVNCQNAEGLTPLMLVCRDIQLFERLFSQLNRHYSPVQVAEELIKSKADLLVTDSDGRSCLHYAAQSHSGSADSLTVALVSGGFDIELCDKHLLTPLHLASQSGNISSVVALAERGSDVNAKGFAGLTPLHMTALKDHHGTALTLLKYGADVTKVDDRGMTPLDMARSRKMKNSLKEALLAATKDSNPSQNTTSTATYIDVDEGMKKSEAAKKSDGVTSNTQKVPMHSQTAKSNQSKILSNVDRCRQVEKKILQEAETFKAAHPMLRRETTRMLGTPRTNILPQIKRGSSPEHASQLSQANVDSKSSPSEGMQRSLEETQNKLTSRGKSVLDTCIKLGLGRPSEKSGASYVNQEAPKDIFKSAHHRSDSDPSAPHIRDLTASCDSLLACTNGKKIVRLKTTDLSLSRDHELIMCNQQATSLIKIKKEPHHGEKSSTHPEGILQSMGSPSEIIRSHSILKEEFILEESRPKEISSGSDPASSISSCSQSSSSPRDLSFIQPSPSRSIRHDPSLSTLMEQHASTHFSVSDSFSNTDGKPLILKPHKRLRKRSDNSLSSSLESDNDDLRTDKVITRSGSLRKSSDTAGNSNQESTSLSNQLHVFKSQSMESISPRAQPKVLEEWLASNSVTAKSNSEGNLDIAEKDSMQATKSKLCEAAANKNVAKPTQAAAKCIKPSKKLIIEPFIGKTKVASTTKVESRNSPSSATMGEKRVNYSKTAAPKINIPQKMSQTSSCEKVDLSGENKDSFCPKGSTEAQQDQGRGRNKLQQQKSNSAVEVGPVLINANDSAASTTESAKLQPSPAMKHVPISVKISRSQEQYKSPEILHCLDSTTQSGSGNNDIGICSSSTSIKSSSISKQFDATVSDMLQAPITIKQSHAVEKTCEFSHANSVTSEESSKLKKSKSNQNLDKINSLDKSKNKETCSIKVAVKQSCSKTDSKDMLLKPKKTSPINLCQENTKMPPRQKKTSPTNLCQSNTNMPPRPPFDKTESMPLACTSNGTTNSPITAAKSLEQLIPNISRIETSAKSLVSKDDVTCSEKEQQLSKMQEESEKDKRKCQDSNKLSLNILKRFYSPKPNIQLKTMSIEPLATNNCQSNVVKTDGDASKTEIHSDLISTPVIVNPFEEFVQAHIKVIDSPSTDALVKVKKTNSNKIINKNVKKTTTTALSRKKPNSGIVRQISIGRKQSAKGKDLKIEKESRPKTGRKSAKGQQSKKTEIITKSKINVDTHIPNNAVISGNGWQLSTSREGKSIIEVSSDLHLYSSDSDFSLDLDEHEILPCEYDHSKETALSKNSVQAFRENTTEDSPLFLELDHTNSAFNEKLPEAASNNLSSMNLDMAQDIHNSLEHRHRTVNHLDIDDQNPKFSQRSSHEHLKSVDELKDFHLSKINPITEQSSSFNYSNAVSTFERTNKDLLLHHDDIHLCERESQNQISKTVNTEFTQVFGSSQYQHANCIINDKIEDQMTVNYEYTPSGKIVRRTQSLKEFQKHNMLKPELKFSQNLGEEKVAEKADNKNDDIDDIIEEILSSTNSSIKSITKNVKVQGLGSRIPGIHTLTESDKSILLKMSSTKFSSPFHAKMTATPKVCSEDVVDDLSEGHVPPHTVSPLSELSSSPSTEDAGKQMTTDQDFHHQTPSAREGLNLGSVAAHPSSKPPHSFFMEVGAPRPVTVRRSSSSREAKRQQINSKNATIVTEEGAQQLVKILSSFKHMELQIGANCGDGSSRNTLGCGGQSAGVSFRSKGRFQEMKANTRPRISTEFIEAPTTGLNKGSSKYLDVCENRVAGSRNIIEDIKSEGGDTIQWKKGNVLGRGAFGTVWCGLTSEGELIAVKQIELTTMDKSKAQHEYENVQVEVEILKTLEHDNIVSYLGTSLEDNIVSIFMQFIPGGSIANILARFGALEESVFRIYTKQILEGVKYLHSNDVIHRDLKGANVMLMHNGVIKLIDFGCAKRLCFNLTISQTELLKSMNGTPFWMAPEVVNESGHGKKSDIWSIGCTVFEMATIKPPWADMNPMAAIFAIGSPSRPVPTLGSKFSHDARDFVSRCMTRDQDARPGASELQEHPFITRQANTRPSRSDD